MKVLLTGATGFLGAHLFRRLLRERVEVALLLREHSDTRRIDPITSSATIIRGDLRDLGTANEAIQKFRADTVIHTAWAGVMNKFRNEALQLDDNLMPTINLLRLALDNGCRNFIGLGSQAEYGPANKIISESEPAKPTTLYGATKLATSILAEQLCAQAGARFAWLRVFSTYGPGEDPEWMIPYLIRKLLAGEKPALTACEQKWDYLYAADAAEAIWSVVNSNASGVFNLGSGQVYTLRHIVEQIRDQIDPALPLGFGEVPYRPDQVMHLQADISRLTAATGWRPLTSLEQGIAEDIVWYKKEAGRA